MKNLTIGLIGNPNSGKTTLFNQLTGSHQRVGIPCISVMGAVARESSRGWMTFSVLWGLNIAYSLSILYYQTVSFKAHPQYSLVCILAVLLFNVVLIGGLRRARSRVNISLLSTRKTAAAACCESSTGDCH